MYGVHSRGMENVLTSDLYPESEVLNLRIHFDVSEEGRLLVGSYIPHGCVKTHVLYSTECL